MTETRLITKATRPDLYRLIEESRASNDNREAFRRRYRRRHPFLTFVAWCAEREWRMIAMIGAAVLIGSVLGLVLP